MTRQYDVFWRGTGGTERYIDTLNIEGDTEEECQRDACQDASDNLRIELSTYMKAGI